MSDLKDVYLYTIDDLQKVVDENMNHRNEAAKSALADVDTAVNDFMRWLYGIRAARSLKLLRQHSHAYEKELTDKALRKLNAGQDPSEVLNQLSSTLTNRILHMPSKRLREAAENQDYDILKAADRIFSPDDGNKGE